MFPEAKFKLDLPLEPLDWFWEGLGFAGFIALIAFPVINYPELPDQIAIHFDGHGNPNRYGSKSTIWLLPAFATVTYIGLIILARFPHLYNFPISVHDENRAYQYRLGARMIRSLNATMNFMFFYIVWKIVGGAQEQKVQMGAYFIVALLGTLALIIGSYIYLAKKHK